MPCSRSAREQDLVRDRPAERADAAAAQIGERAEPRRIGVADAQDLAELVVGNRRRQRGAARGRVFDAAQADVGVAAGDRTDRSTRTRSEHEPRRASEASRDQLRDFDVEADQFVRVASGSASTNGAPPSGSPAHRSSRGVSAHAQPESTIKAATASPHDKAPCLMTVGSGLQAPRSGASSGPGVSDVVPRQAAWMGLRAARGGREPAA